MAYKAKRANRNTMEWMDRPGTTLTFTHAKR